MKHFSFQAQTLTPFPNGSGWSLTPVKITVWATHCLVEDLVAKTKTLYSFHALFSVSSDLNRAYTNVTVQKDTTEVLEGFLPSKHPILVPRGTFDKLLSVFYEFPEENLLMI